MVSDLTSPEGKVSLSTVTSTPQPGINPWHIGFPHGNHVKQYLCICFKTFLSFTDEFYRVKIKIMLCYVMSCHDANLNGCWSWSKVAPRPLSEALHWRVTSSRRLQKNKQQQQQQTERGLIWWQSWYPRFHLGFRPNPLSVLTGQLMIWKRRKLFTSVGRGMSMTVRTLSAWISRP